MTSDVVRDFLKQEARNYDREIGVHAVTGPAVDFLVDLAGQGGSLLEFAVGTGRIALPVAASGVRVVGVDNSPEMLAILAEKDPDGTVPAIAADMQTVSIPEKFDVACCVFNSMHALKDQDEQCDFVRNAASHLKPEGVFVVEHALPAFEGYTHNRRLSPLTLEGGKLETVSMINDPVRQVLLHQRCVITDDSLPRISLMRLRYVTPPELDLMARLAGMHLIARYGGWLRQEFDGAGSCVSLYKLTP